MLFASFIMGTSCKLNDFHYFDKKIVMSVLFGSMPVSTLMTASCIALYLSCGILITNYMEFRVTFDLYTKKMGSFFCICQVTFSWILFEFAHLRISELGTLLFEIAQSLFALRSWANLDFGSDGTPWDKEQSAMSELTKSNFERSAHEGYKKKRAQ